MFDNIFFIRDGTIQKFVSIDKKRGNILIRITDLLMQKIDYKIRQYIKLFYKVKWRFYIVFCLSKLSIPSTNTISQH